MASDEPPAAVDIDRPNAARVYDDLLGGAHTFAADRDFAERMGREIGLTPLPAQLNRSFLRELSHGACR